MPRSLLTAVAFSALFTTGLLARPNAFLVTGPVELVGRPGETVRGTYWCMLSADRGLVGDVTGWSFEIAPSTADLRIVSVTSSGTDAERAFGGGVLSSELTPKGAVVGRAQIDPVLPGVLDDVYREVYLARLTVEAEVPAEGALSSRLEFVVEPRVTWLDGTSAALTPVDLSVLVRPIRNCCLGRPRPPNPSARVSVGFSAREIAQSFRNFAVFIPSHHHEDEDCASSSADRGLRVGVRPGEFGETDIYLTAIRDMPLRAWTLAVGVEGAVVSDVTPMQFESGSTPFVAVVDGSRNGGIYGAVCEFSASVAESESLPITRSLFALRLRSAEVQPADRDLVARVYVQDGLQVGPRSHYVNSFVSEDGQSVRPCNAGTASATVRFIPESGRPFIRGDANGDGIVDISDAIYSLVYQFVGGLVPPCLDALNVRDCGVIDIGDVIVTLSFLFLGGLNFGEHALPPPGPFACGEDPTFDALSCLEYPHCD